MTRQTNTLVPSDMKGLWAFVPACSTPDAADLNAVDTIDTDALTSLVDRLVRDGVDGIVTTGSAGESHTLTDPGTGRSSPRSWKQSMAGCRCL